MQAPHVVLLGAGASVAALPNGDRNGRQLPLMANLVELVGLEPVFRKAGVDPTGKNFEALYSLLAPDPRYADCVADIKRMVFDYFAELRLPTRPTIYDHLLLSLRAKDFIATFNWDPLLQQAVERLPSGITPPQIRYLHGSVAIGACTQHKPVMFGRSGMVCRVCGSRAEPTQLLFPVTQKDYNTDPFIAANWTDVGIALKRAYHFTVFGYGAPSTDVEAVRLLREGWGQEKRLGAIEIIDIRPASKVRPVWEEIVQHVHRTHFAVWNSFYSAQFARYPRRSGESFYRTRMQQDPPPDMPIPRRAGWASLHKWLEPLLEQEALTSQ